VTAGRDRHFGEIMRDRDRRTWRICAWCKAMYFVNGKWTSISPTILPKSDGMCPECAVRMSIELKKSLEERPV
jgi:hypothetical protein